MKNHILLIEDDKFMRKMIALVLGAEEYQVTGAESGGEALRLLSECDEYSAVISDMYLPDLDGLKLFEQINVRYPDLPFLILTSETNEKIVQKAINLGITYILKDQNFMESILIALKK